VKDEPSELDCVLELALVVEEAVDPVLGDEAVLCCAPTLNATKQCNNHILEFHIADGRERGQIDTRLRARYTSFETEARGCRHASITVSARIRRVQSRPIRSGGCVREASGTKANLAAGGLFTRHLEKRRKLTKVCSSPASEISERRVPKRVQLVLRTLMRGSLSDFEDNYRRIIVRP
jgi:hypothetical protein